MKYRKILMKNLSRMFYIYTYKPRHELQKVGVRNGVLEQEDNLTLHLLDDGLHHVLQLKHLLQGNRLLRLLPGQFKSNTTI